VQMSKAQFIRNNHGIDENGDLPEEFLGALYDRIVKNEIKMKSDPAGGAKQAVAAVKPQGGLEAILNLVLPRRKRDVSADTSEDIIRHMQEMFKQKTGKSG
jgi:brefeldin A-inhibited guanine nucleotide-exchange protein